MDAELARDIRWEQRFSNYVKALDKLAAEAAYLAGHGAGLEPVLSDLALEGLVQSFEFTHELAWNVMKDYAEYQGGVRLGGSRDATREAFALGLIDDGKAWMEMIASRNETSHTYDSDTAKAVAGKITAVYLPLFHRFKAVMEKAVVEARRERCASG